MKDLFRSKLVVTLAALFTVAAIVIPMTVFFVDAGSGAQAKGKPQYGLTKQHYFSPNRSHGARPHVKSGHVPDVCAQDGHQIALSKGGRMHCALINGSNHSSSHASHPNHQRLFGDNHNAANPAEDISTSGVQAYGQSETSIAASGRYVVEAWNDASAFFNNCGAPAFKEEATGFGFSKDGGENFTDLGGLPNPDCSSAGLGTFAGYRYGGDPSVEAFVSGGSTYFYISSLYNCASLTCPNQNTSAIALAACKVSVPSQTLHCSSPIIMSVSEACVGGNPVVGPCGFTDKEYLSIDPVHARLYVSYTDFSSDNIDLAVCDLSTPATPTCFSGASFAASPYLTVAVNPTPCEAQGAYPAVDNATGDVYVAWEFNWATNIFTPACFGVPTLNLVGWLPNGCLTLPFPTAPCGSFVTSAQAFGAVAIASMDAAFIPGYNRFPMNDFPRIAVSDPFGTVSIVWNDAALHATGDILLESFDLGGLPDGSLAAVQPTPVVVNNDSTPGAWKFLPATRYSDEDGHIYISWFDRRRHARSAFTDVFAAKDVKPTTTHTPHHNFRVTNVSSDWNAVSSDIIPNFGDYTDNYLSATGSAPFTSDHVFVAWSDGRLGFPQPFEAHNEDD